MYDVRATSGDSQLGGVNFSYRLLKFCVDHLKGDLLDVTSSQDMMRRLLLACENVKKELSNVEETEVKVDWVEGELYQIPITRKRYEELIADYISKTMKCVECMLTDAGMKKDQIHDIVLVGGSTHMPIVHSKLKNFFGKDVNTSIDPIESGNFNLFDIMTIVKHVHLISYTQ